MKLTKHLAVPILTASLFCLSTAAWAWEETENVKLKSFQEVPAVSSAASGHFKAKIDEDAGTISYELTYEGLEGEVRQGHIHFGQRSVNGGISVFLCQTTFNPDPTGLAPVCLQSGSVSGMFSAANIIGPTGQGIAAQEFAELVKAIRAGVAYVNVHSTKFPAGEIRGQFHH